MFCWLYWPLMTPVWSGSSKHHTKQINPKVQPLSLYGSCQVIDCPQLWVFYKSTWRLTIFYWPNFKGPSHVSVSCSHLSSPLVGQAAGHADKVGNGFLIKPWLMMVSWSELCLKAVTFTADLEWRSSLKFIANNVWRSPISEIDCHFALSHH